MTSDWTPTHTDPLLIMAMDQRDSFEALFDVHDGKPTDEQQARMEQAKTLIYRALGTAASDLPAGRAGVLVDEQLGLDVIEAAIDSPYVLALPIEKSGQPWFGLEWGDQWLAHVRALSPAYVKVLVRDNPELDPTYRRQQLDDLARVSHALADEGFAFLYELLVPATPAQLASVDGDPARYDREVRPDLTVRVLADNQNAGVEPAIWKIEGLETLEAAQAIAAQARSGGRTADLIVLGRDAPAEHVDHWLSIAVQVPEFVGFAIGRSNWKSAIEKWAAGDLDDAGVLEQVSSNYLGFARKWTV